jgi:hypothetical protein
MCKVELVTIIDQRIARKNISFSFTLDLAADAPAAPLAFLPDPLGRPRPRFTWDSPLSADDGAGAGAATLFSAFFGS